MLHSCWSQYFPLAIASLYSAPALPPSGVPKFQAHLSPISFPLESYQAVPSGSVMPSMFSWLVTLSTESAGTLLFGYSPDSQPDTAA